ncbi:hypothetical protein Esti_006882 [Eimeria stiedai]
MHLGNAELRRHESPQDVRTMLEALQRTLEIADFSSNTANWLDWRHSCARPFWSPRSEARYALVGIDHLSRRVELAALSRVREEEVVTFLLDVWIPHHGVPQVVLSDNGPQFVAEVVKTLCRATGADKIYSSPSHPQGNSICESFMRTVKRSLASLVSEDGHDWDTYLQVSHSLTTRHPTHTCIDYSPYFLVQGCEAVRPVQRHLDTPPLNPPSERWVARLWAARVELYAEHMKAANERKGLLSEPGAIVQRSTVTAIKLISAELQGVSRKLAPWYSGPWTVTRAQEDGTTYCVQDPVTLEEKQVPGDRVKVLELQRHEQRPREYLYVLAEDVQLEQEADNMVYRAALMRYSIGHSRGPLERFTWKKRDVIWLSNHISDYISFSAFWAMVLEEEQIRVGVTGRILARLEGEYANLRRDSQRVDSVVVQG